MTTIIKCNDNEEFIKCINYIFFSEERAKRYMFEKVSFEYEYIQQFLGIAKEEHDTANMNCEDIELDLYDEFMKGNHKYNNLSFPCYVEWEFTVFGCEAEASVIHFCVMDEEDISLSNLLSIQNELDVKREEYRTMVEKFKNYQDMGIII